MPIYNSKDLIPFVNELEARIDDMNESVSEWDKEKHKLISSSDRIGNVGSTATSALIRADEAMSEISTATFRSSAGRGRRLQDTLNQLRSEMVEIAEQVDGGGGGALTEGMFFDELNNAIASVDATVEDGLKLDYRLREINNMAKTGVELSKKDLYMPYKYEVTDPTQDIVVEIKEEGALLVDGSVTVLNKDGDPFFNEEGESITGTIDKEGKVILTDELVQECLLYFPVKMELKDIPEDFLYLFMEQIIDKNSRTLGVVLRFEDELLEIIEDIKYMKGVRWTPDYSIMRNHSEIVKERISPKGLQVKVEDGMAHATFSYNDHPDLSHFVLEKWDEDTKRFVPYDGKEGIVQK